MILSVASGILAGGGIVFTDLRALLLQGAGGALEPPALPARFAGAPVFDFNGELAGLAVRPSEGEVLLVPASVLLEILNRLQPTVPQQDDHI